MPVPTVDESIDAFIERCIPIVITEGTASNGAQAYAICISMYENQKNTEKHLKDDSIYND